MKVLCRILFFLHSLVGIGAMAGGMAPILNPQNPLGMSVEALKNSPFDNYLIPGIILFAVIGLGNIVGAAAVCFKSKFQGYISGILGGALVIWIVVQCIIIKVVVFLHVLFFCIGLVQAVLSIAVIFKQGLFPSDIIVSFYNKMRKEV